MNMTDHIRRVCGLGLLLGAALGCTDSTPLGTIECIGEHIRCGFTDAQRNPNSDTFITDPTDRVSSTDLPVLAPTLTRTAFEGADYTFTLFADAGGRLWNVRAEDSQVVLEQLDREGRVIADNRIDPPKRARKPERYHAIDLAVQRRRSQQTLDVVSVGWSRNCDGSAGFEDCQFNEHLVFHDLAEAPRRIYRTEATPALMQANDSGEWLMRGDAIDKLDTRGGLLWRQTGLLALSWANQTTWYSVGALRSDNELNAVLWSTSSEISQTEVWQLDARGNIEKRELLNGLLGAPEYAIDARGRQVIAGTTFQGDLTLRRVFNGGVAGAVIEREEFRNFIIDGFALDSDGAVYVATGAGGREPADTREMLCQLPETGSARCFTLGEIQSRERSSILIDNLAVPEPGVVYIRTDETLRRYELPDP